MRITMVKKLLKDGSPCEKCGQAESLLKERGLWERIDEVAIAEEGNPDSPGMKLGRQHGVETAPFFVVEENGKVLIERSVLRLARTLNQSSATTDALGSLVSLQEQAALKSPEEIVDLALASFGERCAIAFSGAEDVALIEMAKETGRSFSVFCLDTGRLHPETYRFIDRVRKHYDIDISVLFPEPLPVQSLVKKKGLFSFYEDGHGECCQIRKVEPLSRALENKSAWITGQRKDQSPTRSELAPVEQGQAHPNLVKFNPLYETTLQQLWQYLRDHQVPTNPLHERGYISIGCEPCTRAIAPGEHERAGRWWWEEATKRECGLHTS